MKLRLFGLACTVALLAGMQEPVCAGELRIGVGRVSITPPMADFPYTPSTAPSLNTGPGERSFVGVHDEIYARALVLDDGIRRAVLLTIEVTAVPMAEDIAKAVALEAGVPPSSVMIAATHTHNVPLFSYAGHDPSTREQREIARVKQGACDAVDIAKGHLQPARVAFGRGKGWINVNNGEQSGSHAGYDPTGPSDKTLDVVRFESPAGESIAMIVNYASHAEVMFRSITRDNGYEVSGDLPGAVARMLEGRSGPVPVVLFTSAAEADQLTLFKSLQPTDDLPAADEGAGGWVLLDVQAHRLADSVLKVLATMSTGTADVRIATAVSSATCPGQQLRLDTKTHQAIVEARPAVVIPLSMLKINGIVLAGVGGDVASAIGEHVKAASPAAETMLVSLAGQDTGYIFSDASYVHPGHGLTKSPLKAGCAEDAIVRGLTQMIKTAP